MNQMTNTYIAGKHLHLPSPERKIERCCLCGAVGGRGFRKKDVISGSFMDNDYLNDSPEICVYCAACLGKGQAQNEQLRTASFLATPSKLLRLKREEIWDRIFFPPDEAFVFGVTYSHKKHIIFKAPVNISGQNMYRVQTENSRVDVHCAAILPLCDVLQQWYTVCKDTKQEPTRFTKAEILLGSRNFKRIEEYGTDRYFKENDIIRPYRQTAILELLVYALNKRKGDQYHD